MTLTSDRQNALATKFGDINRCITKNSWMQAMVADILGEFYMDEEDMAWLRTTPDFCAPAVPVGGETAEKTGIFIDTGGALADVYVGDEKVGSTDVLIEMPAGSYTFVVRKSGFKSRSLAENITDKQILNRVVTLVEGSDTTVSAQTGIFINAGGIGMDVLVNGTKVGTTDTLIEMDAGAYTFVMQKDGYNTITLMENITQSNIRNITVYPALSNPAVEVGPNISMTLTNNKLVPNPIKYGIAQWFGLEVRNDTARAWKGYLGARLVDQAGTTEMIAPDKKLAQTVLPGATVMILRKISVPLTLTQGTISGTLIINGFFIS